MQADGSVTCWGRETDDELEPPQLQGFVAISSGDLHACGLRYNGQVACWGHNFLGQANPPRDLNQRP